MALAFSQIFHEQIVASHRSFKRHFRQFDLHILAYLQQYAVMANGFQQCAEMMFTIGGRIFVKLHFVPIEALHMGVVFDTIVFAEHLLHIFHQYAFVVVRPT